MKFFAIVFLIVFLLGVCLVDALTSVEESALFDIFVEIPEQYREIYAGDELFATIRLVNFGEEGRIDVFLEYEIRDSFGKVILDKKETVAVETQANFIRSFDIIEATVPGSYIFYVKLIYADGVEVDSQHSFEVKSSVKEKNYWILFWILLAVVVVYLGFRFKEFWNKFLIKIKIRRIVKEKEGEGVY